MQDVLYLEYQGRPEPRDDTSDVAGISFRQQGTMGVEEADEEKEGQGGERSQAGGNKIGNKCQHEQYWQNYSCQRERGQRRRRGIGGAGSDDEADRDTDQYVFRAATEQLSHTILPVAGIPGKQAGDGFHVFADNPLMCRDTIPCGSGHRLEQGRIGKQLVQGGQECCW